ncbi:MAG: hypothetical protein ACRDSI_06540 [Pseudonocardiaceae bacterium]
MSTGTANDFARTLGLPTDLDRGCPPSSVSWAGTRSSPLRWEVSRRPRCYVSILRRWTSHRTTPWSCLWDL